MATPPTALGLDDAALVPVAYAPCMAALARALQARWSTAVAWRTTFLDFERPDRVLSRDLVEAFLAELASPAQHGGLSGTVAERTRAAAPRCAADRRAAAGARG